MEVHYLHGFRRHVHSILKVSLKLGKLFVCLHVSPQLLPFTTGANFVMSWPRSYNREKATRHNIVCNLMKFLCQKNSIGRWNSSLFSCKSRWLSRDFAFLCGDYADSFPFRRNFSLNLCTMWALESIREYRQQMFVAKGLHARSVMQTLG